MDHFERLGLPRRFSVDPAAVERAYLALSRAVHPDFHGTASPTEQRASLDAAGRLNEAYLAVRDPVRRAEYLLTLLGGPTAHEEKNLDQTFLAEMMDVREAIDAATSDADKERIAGELRERQAALLTQIESAFAAEPTVARLVGVRRSLNAIRTIQSLLRQLDEPSV